MDHVPLLRGKNHVRDDPPRFGVSRSATDFSLDLQEAGERARSAFVIGRWKPSLKFQDAITDFESSFFWLLGAVP